jgi:hypothetical protein
LNIFEIYNLLGKLVWSGKIFMKKTIKLNKGSYVLKVNKQSFSIIIN